MGHKHTELSTFWSDREVATKVGYTFEEFLQGKHLQGDPKTQEAVQNVLDETQNV